MARLRLKHPIKKILKKRDKDKADILAQKIVEGQELNNGDSTFLNRADVKTYIEFSLNKAGLKDDFLAQKLKKLINAGTSNENLQYVKPAVALTGIRMAYELKDRFPSIKMEQRNINIDMKFQTASIDELKEVLRGLADKTDKFLKMVEAK